MNINIDLVEVNIGELSRKLLKDGSDDLAVVVRNEADGISKLCGRSKVASFASCWRGERERVDGDGLERGGDNVEVMGRFEENESKSVPRSAPCRSGETVSNAVERGGGEAERLHNNNVQVAQKSKTETRSPAMMVLNCSSDSTATTIL